MDAKTVRLRTAITEAQMHAWHVASKVDTYSGNLWISQDCRILCQSYSHIVPRKHVPASERGAELSLSIACIQLSRGCASHKGSHVVHPTPGGGQIIMRNFHTNKRASPHLSLRVQKSGACADRPALSYVAAGEQRATASRSRRSQAALRPPSALADQGVE